jgi:hypothetical protein
MRVSTVSFIEPRQAMSRWALHPPGPRCDGFCALLQAAHVPTRPRSPTGLRPAEPRLVLWLGHAPRPLRCAAIRLYQAMSHAHSWAAPHAFSAWTAPFWAAKCSAAYSSRPSPLALLHLTSCFNVIAYLNFCLLFQVLQLELHVSNFCVNNDIDQAYSYLFKYGTYAIGL